MPLCHHRKLKLIHIPKTGGTALVKALALEWTGYHDSWSAYPLETEAYTSFTVVRNPLERFVSQYNFGMSKRTFWHIQGTRHEFPDYHVMKVMTLEQLLEDLQLPFDRRRLRHCGWWPQSSFICNAVDEICVGTVLRQESLQNDLDQLLERLELPRVTVQELNQSEKCISVQDILWHADLLSQFLSIYSRDYRTLDYRVPEPMSPRPGSVAGVRASTARLWR